MGSLGDIGEHEAIRRLTARLGSADGLVLGTGDDCAVAALPGSGFDQVFTSDPVIEGVHFLPTDDPRRIGNKAAGRVLSDIAAMGAHPQWMLVDVVAPRSMDFAVLEGIYAGLGGLCSRFGATIIGGDMAQGPVLELHLFGTGLVPSGTALLRSGARPGDHLFTTGALGGSRSGKHLDFVPRVEEGLFLRETGWVHAMMDISDGLATDLRHILQRSGVGGLLVEKAIPMNGTLEQALHDGEDFELLLAAPPCHGPALMECWKERFGGGLACIGSVTDRPGCLELCRRDGSVERLESKAFEHFSNG